MLRQREKQKTWYVIRHSSSQVLNSGLCAGTSNSAKTCRPTHSTKSSLFSVSFLQANSIFLTAHIVFPCSCITYQQCLILSSERSCRCKFDKVGTSSYRYTHLFMKKVLELLYPFWKRDIFINTFGTASRYLTCARTFKNHKKYLIEHPDLDTHHITSPLII